MKKFLALFLAVLCVMQILPFSAMAEEGTTAVIEDEASAELQEEKVSADTEAFPEETDASEAAIVGEVVSLREENIKHFRTSDGGYIAAVYGYPVHYEQNGEWKDLDMTLEEKKDEESGKTFYETAEQGISVSVPENISEDSLKYSYNGYEIAMSYQGKANQGQSKNKAKKVKIKKSEKKSVVNEKLKTEAQKHNAEVMTLNNLSSAVEFVNADKNVDLEYHIATNGIKEDIIVDKAENNYLYTFLIEAGGLIPTVQDDNTIALTDRETGEIIFLIDAPLMYDAAGAESNAIKLNIKEKDGKYELTVHADKSWINDKERKFPVTIDPTVKLNIARTNILDTYADNSDGNDAPRQNDYYLYAGNNDCGLTRTYVKFNLPALPKTAAIVDAQFSMWQTGWDWNASTQNTAVLNAYDLYGKSSWDCSSLKWSKQPIGTAHNAASGLTVIDYCNPKTNKPGEAVLYSWDVTKIAKRWYEDGQNNGILITSSNENSFPFRMQFVSSDFGSSASDF